MTTDELVEEIVVRCRQRIERGEEVDSDEVVRAHPEMAEKLRDRFAALRKLDAAFGRRGPDDEADRPSLAGCLLGPYRLGPVLGSGGMGTVYLGTVEDKAPGLEIGARVAVKVLHPHLFARRGYFKRFLREAELGRRVRHENVVRTLDVDEVAAARFLVMEYVEGQTLRSLVEELGRVPEELCRHVGREVAKALAAVHEAGAVHRDVKPDNVIITRDNAVKLMDLGVARLADEAMRLSQTGAFVGSVSYASPEQFQKGGADVDGRADLYALGLTLYELATGEHPFAADDFHVVVRRQMAEAPRPVGAVNPQVSPLFEALLSHLLEKDREKRPASAAAVAEILERGEESAWWKERAKAIREEAKRPLRRIRIPRETALYGRDAELAKLRDLFDAAKAGDGGVVLVEGEAGIGKSRLVDEFVGQLHASGEEVNYLFGSYPPGGAATASGAFTTAYREQFGGEGLETTLARYLTVTPLLVPAFAALLRGEPPPEGHEPLTKDSLQTVFVHATRALAAERTTVVLIDDLHFAPEEGRALFASLALAVPGHRVLLVGCTRPGLDERWIGQLARHPHATQIAVPRLGPKELVHLLRDALKSERLAEELAALIAVKSDGNPFFVFEILRGLREGQFLSRRPDGTWHTTHVIRDIQIPSSITDLVNARVADLDEADRDLLDVAACVGFEFDPSLVAAALGAPVLPTLKRFGQIERKHRLVRSAGRRMVFDHHQVQEALHGGLMEQVREHYHAAIAGALEAQHGAATSDPTTLDGALCVDLAEHFLKGAQGARALRYLDAALSHLTRSYFAEAAVRLAKCALAIPGLVEGRARARLLLVTADCLESLGSAEAERAVLDESVELADAASDLALRARTRCALGAHLVRVGSYAQASEQLLEALSLAYDVGDRTTEAIASGTLAAATAVTGRYADARKLVERQLALAADIGDRRLVAAAKRAVAALFGDLGYFESCRRETVEALAMYVEIGDRRGEAASHGNLAFTFECLGKFADARTHVERALEIVDRIGERRLAVRAIGNRGGILRCLGRLGEAHECYERMLAVSRETGSPAYESLAHGGLAGIALTYGRITEAREHHERYIDLVRHLGNPREEGNAMHQRAEVQVAEGDAVAALASLAEALTLRRSIGRRDGEAQALVAIGLLFVDLDRLDDAIAKLDAGRAIAREHAIPSAELLAAAALARTSALPAAEALEVLRRTEERVAFGIAMRARFLLWQATVDLGHLFEAKRRLDQLVAHAPPDCRETMLTNVRLHSEIAEAARAAGI